MASFVALSAQMKTHQTSMLHDSALSATAHCLTLNMMEQRSTQALTCECSWQPSSCKR